MGQFSSASINSRRRTFWTTQPGGGGFSASECGDAACGIPSLAFNNIDANCGHCQCCPGPAINPTCETQAKVLRASPRSFVTNDWVRSLVLNILMTDGKLPNKACGHRPGAQGGHWSESFRTDKQKIGTLIRATPTTTSIRDAVALIKAQLVSDMSRLIVVGVASSVNVVADYIGGSRMSVNIEVVGQDGALARVGLTGKRLQNSWVWA